MSLHGVEKYVFVNEWQQTDPWSAVSRPCIEHPAAVTTATTLRCGLQARSVAFKESVLERRQQLPTGARSLLVDASEGSIVARGLNKFSDLSECDLKFIFSCAQHSTASIFLQRKMAGYIVHMFSVDGISVEVMSKHTTDGPHAQFAYQLIQNVLGQSRLALFAKDLRERNWVVTCECIATSWDVHHPILESMTTPALIVLSAQHRTSLQEVAEPVHVVRAWCAAWSLVFVETVVVDKDLVSAATVAQWQTELGRWSFESEGYVLLLEIPLPAVASAVRCNQDLTVSGVVPIRFKLKTLRYTTLRCLRSVVLGEHVLHPSHEYFHHPYLVHFLEWAIPALGTSVDAVRERVREKGIWFCSRLFESSLGRSHKRLRDADVPTSEVPRLIMLTEHIHQQRKALHLVGLVMLCGLPGAGKSTVATEIAATLTADDRSSSVDRVVILCRDEVAQKVAQASGISADSSNHQRRKLKKLVHDAIVDKVAATVRWLTANDDDLSTLVVLDACHASRDARRMFRELFPTSLGACVCVHVKCSAAMERASLRSEHPILCAADAPKAFQDVQRVFIEPSETSESSLRTVLSVDTVHLTPKEAAAVVLSEVKLQMPRPSRGQARLLTTDNLPPLPFDNAASLWESFSRRGETHRSLRTAQFDVIDKSVETWLWKLVAEALVGVAPSPSVCPDGEPSGWAKGVVSAISDWWHGKAKPSVAGTIEQGHVMWLAGKFIERNSRESVTDSARLVEALKQRYDADGGVLHVTVAVCRGLRAAEDVAARLQEMGLEEGAVLEFTAVAVLVDDKAVCIEVQAIETSSRRIQDFVEWPLHVTLGHTHHVGASYAATMGQQFAIWHAENELGRSRRLHAPGAGRQKMHNFVKVRLGQPSPSWSAVLHLN